MRPSIRRVPALAVSPLLAVGLLGLPTVDIAPPSPEPVTPELSTLPLPGVQAPSVARLPLPEPDKIATGLRRQSDGGGESHGHEGDGEAAATLPVATTQELSTEPYRVVAVTWDSGQDPPSRVDAWVRHRTEGTWSDWYRLPAADDHGPDAGTAEAAAQRDGTDPLVVPESDGVQARVDTTSGEPLAGLRLDLIDPGYSAADGESTGAAAAAAAAAQPEIRSRAQWGADEGLRRGAPAYGQIKAAFVHHTVNSNSYSMADVPAIIRGIYAYHVQSRGWQDIGYNFLVDRFGRIWEGRYGGVSRPVVGAHTFGHNDDAFAMSAIGTYTSTQPTGAVLDAYARLFAWKFGLHGVDPRSVVNLDGVRANAISGHRDTYPTACPGDALYARLPAIRSQTAALMTSGSSGRQVRVELADAQWSSSRVRAVVTTAPALASKPVVLRARSQPDPKWQTVAEGRLDAGGRSEIIGGRLAAGTYDIKAVVRANPVKRSETSRMSVADRPVRASLTARAMQRGEPVDMAVVAPASAADQPVVLLRHAAGSSEWRKVQRGQLDQAGRTAFTLSPPLAGTYRFKARVAAVLPRGSNTVRLTVAADAEGGVPSTGQSRATVRRPADGVFSITGRGWGHGRGMSQWGAREAGRRGVPEPTITSTYYPGTERSTARGNPRVRSLITADTGTDLIVRPEPGLKVRFQDEGGVSRSVRLPATVAGCRAAWWRAVAGRADIAIQSLCGDDWLTWRGYGDVDGGSPVTFATPDSIIDVAVRTPSGFDRRGYRGAMRAHRSGSNLIVVNIVRMQGYLRSVVPSESPASWPTQTLRAQSVAARSYALRERRDRTGPFDVYDSTLSQVYPGAVRYDTSWQVIRRYEYPSTSRAVTATKSIHLRYAGIPAFTQFSSSNGGVRAAGPHPYLSAGLDPWDAAAADNPRRTWTDSVAASTLERRYPALGRLVAIRVAEREGVGKWGGRVEKLVLVGSNRDVVVSGDSEIRAALGTYSAYLTVSR